MQAPRRDYRQLVSAYFDPANHARLSAVIPVLAGPFHMAGKSRLVCENTMFVDWGLPPCRKNYDTLRHIREPEDLYGMLRQPKPVVLWRCYGYWEIPGYTRLFEEAVCRGFEVKDATEFHTWLKQHTLACLHLPANAGLPALEASLHKLLSASPTAAATPAVKVR